MNYLLGQRVIATDPSRKLHPAVIVTIPMDQRDSSGSQTYTTKGAFPKVWLRFPRFRGAVIPWPAADVYTDLDEAKAAMRALEDREEVEV